MPQARATYPIGLNFSHPLVTPNVQFAWVADRGLSNRDFVRGRLPTIGGNPDTNHVDPYMGLYAGPFSDTNFLLWTGLPTSATYRFATFGCITNHPSDVFTNQVFSIAGGNVVSWGMKNVFATNDVYCSRGGVIVNSAIQLGAASTNVPYFYATGWTPTTVYFFVRNLRTPVIQTDIVANSIIPDPTNGRFGTGNTFAGQSGSFKASMYFLSFDFQGPQYLYAWAQDPWSIFSYSNPRPRYFPVAAATGWGPLLSDGRNQLVA